MTLSTGKAISITVACLVLMAGAWRASALLVPDEVPIPSLKERKRPGQVVFSHWVHDQYRCFVCHPSMFPQERMGFDHDSMKEGRFCGACHDGESAFSHRSRCIQCHEAKEAN